MHEIPLRRFRRELRKWIRLNETVAITRCGVIVGYLVPIAEYDEMLEKLRFCTKEGANP